VQGREVSYKNNIFVCLSTAGTVHGGTWSYTGNLNTARYGHTATLCEQVCCRGLELVVA